MITLDMVQHLAPPAIYDYEPRQQYTIREFHEFDIVMKAFCKREDKLVLGCTVGNIIYIYDDLTEDAYDLILRHEKAHVNGWKPLNGH